MCILMFVQSNPVDSLLKNFFTVGFNAANRNDVCTVDILMIYGNNLA